MITIKEQPMQLLTGLQVQTKGCVCAYAIGNICTLTVYRDNNLNGSAEKGKKRLERKRGGGEMDNQQIESFQIKQRCKVNRESHTLSSN